MSAIGPKSGKMSPKGATRHSQATERGKNAAQGCRPALTGDRKGHKRRPRVSPGTLRQRTGARTSPKGAGRHSEATNRGENVAQGCRPALTGDRKGHKRRPRVSPGTLRQRTGARTSPKGAGRHSEATNRGENVAQGCRPALLGNEQGRERRPRAQGSTFRRRKGARTSPKGAGQHPEATNRGENVAQGRRAALLGDEKGRERRPRAQGSTLRQRTGARTLPKGAGRHSEATNMKEFVASGCRASHAALISLNIFCQAPIAKSA